LHNSQHIPIGEQETKKGEGGNNNVMKGNKTYTQNEKNFSNNFNFLKKNLEKKRKMKNPPNFERKV
jgi:hypothetical protein